MLIRIGVNFERIWSVWSFGKDWIRRCNIKLPWCDWILWRISDVGIRRRGWVDDEGDEGDDDIGDWGCVEIEDDESESVSESNSSKRLDGRSLYSFLVIRVLVVWLGL